MTIGAPRIAIIGAGVAGAILAHGLRKLDCELVVVERVARGDHSEAGTGLNVGPNAVKALRAFFPDLSATVEAGSLPWRRWFVELANGTRLIDLDVEALADNPGIRVRWSELYRMLRAPVDDLVRFETEATGHEIQPDGRITVALEGPGGAASTIKDIDLLIAGDGRYSRFRSAVVGRETPRQLGIAIFRLLVDCGDDCPIDDYGQWFNGPNRLLAFRIPDDKVYIAGTFPIPQGAEIPDASKHSSALAEAFLPTGGPPGPAVDWMVKRVLAMPDALHWARIQDADIAYARPGLPILLVGDAAHPMVPTLGQGATQAIEDACVVQAMLAPWLKAGLALKDFPVTVENARQGRVNFVADFSREATDTMLPGSDTIGGTLRKAEPGFTARLSTLYRNAPMPTGASV